MVLAIAEALYTDYFPSQHWLALTVTAVVLYSIWTYFQGRKTTRERDLHARVFILTGAFTSTGLTLLQNLAERGAHVIALTPEDVDSPEISTLIELLRSTTSNAEVFAEQCDLSSPTSINAFCTNFLKGKDQRLDGLIFAHEYEHIPASTPPAVAQKLRKEGSLATFLITTLLLPSLLVAPVERDIRLINVVNPFYAAARASFVEDADPSATLVAEGQRSLRTIIISRHLQRILDALPSAQIPKTENTSTAVPVVSAKEQKSNIVSVSVSPGISRTETVFPMFATHTGRTRFLLYIFAQPLLRLFTRNPRSAIQSILHAAFLPTPFKLRSSTSSSSSATESQASSSQSSATRALSKQEVLKPGALYADCAVVTLGLPVMLEPETQDEDENQEKKKKSKAKAKGKSQQAEDELVLPNDGEYGGEVAGRRVWEMFEEQLKEWEKEHVQKPGALSDPQSKS